MHDLVFRNARVFDGSGAAGTLGDLAVAGGRIAELGRGVGAGREEIDAEGLALMPGIIDSHTHYDAQATWDPALTPSPFIRRSQSAGSSPKHFPGHLA